MVRLRTCSPSDVELLVGALNDCLYRGYRFNVVMTAERFVEDGRIHDVDLASSFLAFDGDKVVGVALVARRLDRAWIAGMGVLPPYRSQGLGSELLGEALRRLRAFGVRTVLLEVLVENRSARRCYEKAGFVAARGYHCLRGSAPQAHHSRHVRVRASEAKPVVDQYTALHRAEQCWQRDLATLKNRATTLHGLVAEVHGSPAASLLFSENAISDVGHTDGGPPLDRVLPSLLEAAFGPRPFAIVNVPDDDPLCPALRALGCEVYAEQIDMRCSL
jgi:GNAT superfamily N-acetyltransferase